MKKITRLDELLSILPQCSGPDYLALVDQMDIPPEDFLAHATWEADRYTRNCLARSEDYELLLLCWDAQQDTPIHCHGGEECWVYNIEGGLLERRFEEDEKGLPRMIAEEQLPTGGLSYMNDDMGFHSLHNLSDRRAMTLHLYMNPIDRCRIYHPEEERFVLTELTYDSIAEAINY